MLAVGKGLSIFSAGRTARDDGVWKVCAGAGVDGEGGMDGCVFDLGIDVRGQGCG